MTASPNTRLGAALSLFLLLAACGGQAVRDEPLGDGEARQDKWTTRWRENVGGMSPFLQITQYENLLCTVSKNGLASIVDWKNGKRRSFPMNINNITAASGCDDGAIAAINRDGMLVAYDTADGTLLWRHSLQTRSYSAPLVRGTRLYSSGLNDYITAHHSRKNTVIWRFVPSEQQPLRTPVVSAPVLSDGTLFVGIANGFLIALNAADGKPRWRNTVAEALHSNPVANIIDLTTPVVRGNIVCVGAYQGGVACFDANDGTVLWRKRLSTTARAAFDRDNNRLFVADDDGVLHAFDARHGDLLWRQTVGGKLSPPVAVGDAVIVGDDDGVLHAFAVADGAPSGVLSLPSQAVIDTRRLRGGGDDIVVLTLDGDLFRIQFDI